MAVVRSFFYQSPQGRVDLPEIDPGMTPDDIRKFYASLHPALTNAKIIYPDEQAGERTYQFEPTKGGGAPATGGGAIEFKPSIGKKG